MVFIDYIMVVNGEYYVKLLRHLQKAIEVKHAEKLMKGVLCHQDNTLACNSLLSTAVMRQRSFVLSSFSAVTLLLISPGLFSNMKNALGWKPVSN